MPGMYGRGETRTEALRALDRALANRYRARLLALAAPPAPECRQESPFSGDCGPLDSFSPCGGLLNYYYREAA